MKHAEACTFTCFCLIKIQEEKICFIFYMNSSLAHIKDRRNKQIIKKKKDKCCLSEDLFLSNYYNKYVISPLTLMMNFTN